jgi:DNA polymerase
VPGDGPEDAEIMFVGEAPGWHEDQQGKPFVGPAGQFLNQLLDSIQLKRDQVYITKISACHPWLERQIELIKPKMLVTLGRYSMALFFPGKTIGKIHGQPQQRDGVIYFPMYHPAAALHQQALRPTIEADMQKIPGLLAEVSGVPEVREEPPQQQLSMF